MLSSSTRISALHGVLLLVLQISNVSETFSLTTCPATGTRLGYARQHYEQQRQQQNGAVRHPSISSLQSRLYSVFYDDFESFYEPNENSRSSSSNSKDDGDDDDSSSDLALSLSDADLFASLKARQDSLIHEKEQTQQRGKQLEEKENERFRYNWNEANCLSTVRLTINDWIRRIAVDLYPLVVCGSSRGNLYLGDLEDGEEMDCLEDVHVGGITEIDGPIPHGLEQALQAMYAGYDGDGPLAIAVKKDLIVSSGREGGIYACTIAGEESELAYGSRGGTGRQTKLKLRRGGRFRGLLDDNNGKKDGSPPPLITSLSFDDRGTLWAGGYDGKLRGFEHEKLDVDGRPIMLRQKRPKFEIDVESPILDINVVDETGCVVVTTQTDGVFLYSLDDGRFLLHVNPFASSSEASLSSKKQFCRTAMIVRSTNSTTTEEEISEYGSALATLLVGGSFGHLFQFPIRINGSSIGTTTKARSVSVESMQKIRPKHMGPIVALSSPCPGLFVTAAHDGTVRVWDCSVGGLEDDDDDVDDGDNGLKEDSVNKSTLKIPKRAHTPNVLYALSGYKVWLGSVFANKRKLVSDGADNTIIVHSFDEDEEAIMRSQQEDEDEDFDDRSSLT